MNRFIQVFLACFLLVNFTISLNAQNVVINYQTWTGASGCDVFNSLTNVPATVNGVANTIGHVTLLGDTKYSSSDQALQLDNSKVSITETRGTKFRLNYSFKKFYKYIITVNSASSNTSNFPSLRADLTINGGGGGTTCNGPETVSPDLSGDPTPIQYTNLAFEDKQFAYTTPLEGNYSTLELTAIPGQNAGNINTIRIRKITIIETPPPPAFSLAPNPIPVTCGTGSTKIFTITNVYNSPGVTGYTWNLGAGNGWLYNGSPAPASIPTGPTANTLTLTSTGCTALSSVSASAQIGGTSYSTGAVPVIVAQPILSITGNAGLCTTTGSYQLNGVPCGALVTWESSNPLIATVPSGASNPVTVTKTGTGSFALTAKVTLCGVQVPTTLPLTAGSPATPPYVNFTSDDVSCWELAVKTALMTGVTSYNFTAYRD